MLELLSFLETPIGRLTAALVGAAFASLVAFQQGYSLRGKLDGTAAEHARAEWLQKELNAAQAAAAKYAAQAKIDNDALAKRTEEDNNAVASVSAGACLDGNDADRLRDLWGHEPRKR